MKVEENFIIRNSKNNKANNDNNRKKDITIKN